MSVWLEIHCDNHELNTICYNNEHNYCMGMARNTLESQNQVYKTLKADAIKKGWIFHKNLGWRCPNCKEVE